MNSLRMALEDECCREQLIHIAWQHVKLALEFGQPNTSKNRRETIKKEIALLRTERDTLLCDISANKKQFRL
ncbi:hypothetical protein BC351_17575 [Paenibacillus ferrarius]|uniref:Uncharacterized protein n=1 Tax=Paenibacillus ferrarius TaxID=1469647 RepID=A0A1V4HQY7_9BACL|nr:hypothetical protein [Paenibacillus ferrarius]OPH60308.1 hypothetical protein BC351_17575 [Paenibacillus ferrarius]